MTSEGISTFAVAIPASASADSTRNVVVAVDRRPAAQAGDDGHQRHGGGAVQPDPAGERGARAPKTANASTGSDVSSPVSGPGHPEPVAHLLEHRARR